MQGKKNYQEELFQQFQLSDRVPGNNFYRRLRGILDLECPCSLTREYYGTTVQKSIDPLVFFKLCLVGYLEDIVSDRRLIGHCGMRMDILLFPGHDIDGLLPWHSTISRARQPFPESVFENVLTQVFGQCVGIVLVSGHTQVMDSAPVEADASMDSL